jgi:PAS domain S-box-containing protein
MSERIVIIDGDRDLARALKVYLERQKFDVHTIATACGAMEPLAPASPSILLADPDTASPDEIAALRMILKTSPKARLIIYSLPESLEKSMKIFQDRADGYLRKPVNGMELDILLKNAKKWRDLEEKLECAALKIKSQENDQALFQQLFNEVPCYITVQDKNFRITATNRLFKRDFGHEIGEFCYQIYKHRTSPCTDCPVAATFTDGRRHQTEEVVTSKSGEQYHVLTWTAPIRNPDGEITQVMEMATNITQIRQLQDHLTSLGLMLGSMSHGIKGMLTALDGGIYLLETGITRQDPDRTRRAFDQVRAMVDRIRKTVLDILYFTKSRKLEYLEIDVTELVRSIKDIIEPAASQHGIEFDVIPPESPVIMEVDPVWFRSALVNFLENAVDACISDTKKDPHHIRLRVFLSDGDHVCFEVADNGMGMDQETREKMFTLFFSSKGSKGTGLGLFVSNHVIRQHGGSIRVESAVKTGSRFEICIPRTRAGNPLLNG